MECESLKRQLEKWQTGQLTRLADGRISAESPTWREKHDALKKRVVELEAELAGTNDTADRQRERAKAAERERDAHRAEVERVSAERDALWAALNGIASWSEGAVVDSSFDCPYHARAARDALAKFGGAR